MKTSKVFKQARKLIAAGKYTFICHACASQSTGRIACIKVEFEAGQYDD